MAEVLYVYAVTREPILPEVEGIDGTGRFGIATIDAVGAVFTAVNAGDFSQEAIDARAGDLAWLGAIGYRHQSVVSELMRRTAVVPLRAFTLFSSEEALRSFLQAEREPLMHALDRLEGTQEWTVRIEIDPARWSDALVSRVDSLRDLEEQIRTAAPGKAFLLRKKLEEEKKRASQSAETQLVAEVEQLIVEKLRCRTFAESRERRGGAFPQINVLLRRGEETDLQTLHEAISARYEKEGVSLGLTGPWPPYTFAGGLEEGRR